MYILTTIRQRTTAVVRSRRRTVEEQEGTAITLCTGLNSAMTRNGKQVVLLTTRGDEKTSFV